MSRHGIHEVVILVC